MDNDKFKDDLEEKLGKPPDPSSGPSSEEKLLKPAAIKETEACSDPSSEAFSQTQKVEKKY